ncbi:MAG: hypothetical protein NTW16_16445 [Bacteroidetes bacterium]|nr:hypothetical protein [Bacteroidota bacterium]
MQKKKKRLAILGMLLLFSMVILALGLKYFPFTKMVKMPAGLEKEFVNPEKVQDLSPHSLYYDFEVAPGKAMPSGFYKGLAHSGQYSVKAFGQNSFSVVVERTAGEIGVENLKAVALSAWIYVLPTKNDVKGSLVFTASNEVGVNVCWRGLAVTEPEVPKGKWFKISTYIDLTSIGFKPGYKLQVYFWNNSSTDILIDDYFIAFGGAVDRRGDSARVDMTKPAGYIQKLNYPPFPVSLLEKESLEPELNAADTDPADAAISGDFLHTGNDGLLLLKKDGSLASYAFCPENREFRKIKLTNPAAVASVAPVNKIVKGRFLSTQTDQFIVTGEKGWMLAELNPSEKPCNSASPVQTGLKIIWKSNDPVDALYAGDFDGDQRSEILMISDKGSWKVMSFEPDGKSGGAWKVVVSDNNSLVTEWDRNVQETGISVGRFLSGTPNDVVLTVSRNKKDGKPGYSLRKLNVTAKNWEHVYNEKQNHSGKTIGLDTLKPADLFFSLPGEGNRMVVYRYNRDWRYDLKEIRFSDTSFSIVATVDFHGYDKDQNPKYYESLKLVPGRFLNGAAGSFLVMGHVPKSRHYQTILPDFVHLYSLPVNK